MPTIDGEIVIGRPVEVVFDYVTDQRNETAYNPRMVSSRKLTDGPVGVGTRFHATVRAGRWPVDMLIEVTGYRRPQWFGSKTTMSSADIDGGLTFRQVPGGTRMSWSWRLAPKGVLRLFPPVMGYLGRRQERRIWTGLKHHLEGEPPA